MDRYDVMIRVQIDARDHADAFKQARSIEELVRNPFVKGQLENEGVRVASEPVVFMPQQNRG